MTWQWHGRMARQDSSRPQRVYNQWRPRKYLFWFHTLEGRIELSNTATAAACARACAVARRGGAPPPRPFSSPLTRAHFLLFFLRGQHKSVE